MLCGFELIFVDLVWLPVFSKSFWIEAFIPSHPLAVGHCFGSMVQSEYCSTEFISALVLSVGDCMQEHFLLSWLPWISPCKA